MVYVWYIGYGGDEIQYRDQCHDGIHERMLQVAESPQGMHGTSGVDAVSLRHLYWSVVLCAASCINTKRKVTFNLKPGLSSATTTWRCELYCADTQYHVAFQLTCILQLFLIKVRRGLGAARQTQIGSRQSYWGTRGRHNAVGTTHVCFAPRSAPRAAATARGPSKAGEATAATT